MRGKTILVLAVVAAFVIGTMVGSAEDVFAKEKLTKLQKECKKEPKKDDKIKAHCELLNMIFNLQAQVDSFGESLQIDPEGTATIAISGGDITLEVGDGGKVNIIGDTQINSLFEVGPTNIDSDTGDVNVGGDLICDGCIDESDLGFDPATQAELDSKSIDDADADPTNELQTLVITPRTNTKTISPGSITFFTIKCQSGEVAVGGGWVFLGPDKAKATIIDSGPNLIGGPGNLENAWFVQATLDSSASSDVDFTGIVKCIKLQ